MEIFKVVDNGEWRIEFSAGSQNDGVAVDKEYSVCAAMVPFDGNRSCEELLAEIIDKVKIYAKDCEI